MTDPQRVQAGCKVGPGKYVCVDCGKVYEMTEAEQDLRKCPSCECSMYDCLPMTHIRDDVKTPDDAKHPPKR
jgi:hypothetical protein